MLFTFFKLVNAYALTINFNQAWFKNNYGHQYSEKSFDAKEVDRIFKLAQAAGSTSIRLWFFEDARFSMIDFEKNKPISLKQTYIDNVIKVFKLAQKYELKIYMTLFDAHQLNPLKYDFKNILRFRSIVDGPSGPYFVENILVKLLAEIKLNRLDNVIDKIDLMNEADTFINRFGFKRGWFSASKMLCRWRESIQSVVKIPVSFSVRLHPLTPLPFNFFSDEGPMQCADYIDVHSYHDQGKIFRCQEIRKSNKTVVLGEFGQAYFNKNFDSKLQLENTKNYVNNAIECGVDEMFAWRLSDIRSGYNKEARYSFEANGKLREAYYFIQDFNGF